LIGLDSMERGLTGRFETITVGGEAVRAFVPDRLPPTRRWSWTAPARPASNGRSWPWAAWTA